MSCSGETIEDDGLIQIRPAVTAQLRKAGYGVSDHSTVELCHWTKKSFRGEGNCYKHRFYGISTHRCMEFSPAGMYCQNRCVYCWRPMEFYESMKMEQDRVAQPQEILEELLKERKRLIMGRYGDPRCDRNLLDESQLPTHYAISLSGEPTMYPMLPDLIRYLRSLKPTKSIFLVTNGQEPDMIRRLADEDALPTQLYLSCNAPDLTSFLRINRPRYADSWERWNQTLDMLGNLDTRTVLRVTLIRGLNTSRSQAQLFADMFDAAAPHFIEIKSYMHIGRSTNRLQRDSMMEIDEVRDFAETVSERCEFAIADESPISRVVLLQNRRRLTDRLLCSQAT